MKTKICTDVEQSNKLIELGVDVNTADMCYHFIEINKTPLCVRWEKVHDDEKDNSLPAWSLSALINVLPQGTRLLKSATDEMYHCDCPKGNIDKWFDNPIDAGFEMVCWLLENKKI